MWLAKKLLLFITVASTVSVQENISHVVGKDGPVPGSVRNISKNDPGVKKAALNGVYTFNNMSNDMFLFKVLTIKEAHVQIVRGIKYLLDVNISRTVCKKMDHPPDLKDCSFQPDGNLHQVFPCHFEVWVVHWQNWTKTVLSCSV